MKSNYKLIKIHGENVIADSSGGLYWKRKRGLIISDLHLGKTMHFRKKGMALPQNLDFHDLVALEHVIEEYRPRRAILLGDLFHSDYNIEWERFASFTQEYKKGHFILVRGNHDILEDWHYARSNMEIVDELIADPFIFTHKPLHNSADRVNICGHVHPGIKLFGKGRQRIRLPAFFFRRNQILVPAFGRFTGSISIKPKKEDLILALADGKVIEIQQ